MLYQTLDYDTVLSRSCICISEPNVMSDPTPDRFSDYRTQPVIYGGPGNYLHSTDVLTPPGILTSTPAILLSLPRLLLSIHGLLSLYRQLAIP